MSDERKPDAGAHAPQREEPLRDLPAPQPDAPDEVRGGARARTEPSPVPIPYPN